MSVDITARIGDMHCQQCGERVYNSGHVCVDPTALQSAFNALPRPEPAPMTLEEAVAYLDRLHERAEPESFMETFGDMTNFCAAFDALLAHARATLAQRREGVSEVEVEALQEVIMWALGEGDDFPERPERVDGKPYPFYWWRTEMRRRYTAALAASGEGA